MAAVFCLLLTFSFIGTIHRDVDVDCALAGLWLRTQDLQTAVTRHEQTNVLSQLMSRLGEVEDSLDLIQSGAVQAAQLVAQEVSTGGADGADGAGGGGGGRGGRGGRGGMGNGEVDGDHQNKVGRMGSRSSTAQRAREERDRAYLRAKIHNMKVRIYTLLCTPPHVLRIHDMI